MIKEIIKITNKNVDFLNLLENHLSIQLSLDGFSFCIYNKIQEEIGIFAVYEFQNCTSPYKHLELLEKLYRQVPMLRNKYDSVSVVHSNNLVSQVPNVFLDRKNLSKYLEHTVKVLEDDYITIDEIYNSDIVNVYIPFININNFLLDTYGSFIYKHSSTILIEKLLNFYKHKEDDFCFVNVASNNFEIVVLKKGKFILFNSFNFSTKEDFIYYILFIAEQLNLNPEEFNLVLLGDIEKDSELYTILFQYVRNISFYKPTNFPSELNHISAHSHFTLLNQL
ncbi:MAG: DUF3822 family protein [Lutibacter sp.]|uniref:DUF3822 family protein n=1 Tax=Lutibacter sp. TaxID=1925666 RepID=UPI0017A044B0|nr:DUF3822 family protein [Lutibacter sp.]MBT8317803.1 DUF3822 family protein [Lutibacter sp.]NNJ58661.1 DUF3822 family protein [Lutibacter sp.]